MKRILTHNLIRSAEKYPDRIAFKQMDKAISYKELVSKSNKVARYLLSVGIKKGDRVGIYMNRSIESCYALYGILMAGAVYVPIDSSLPAQRVISLIEDCSIDTLITKNGLKKKVKELLEINSGLTNIIGLNEDLNTEQNFSSWDEIECISDALIEVDIDEEDIAYIIYTSGTTGIPKGIVHSHYSGCSYAKLSAELYEINYQDILANHSHLHFDISTMGYLTMPYVGGCTVIIPEAYTKFPASLVQLTEDEKISVWYSVPLALIQMLNSGVLPEKNLSALRWILFGGESYDMTSLKSLIECIPHAMYSNVYGPAEVNQCTFYNFSSESTLSDVLPLGRAWPETAVELIKENSEDKYGEIVVASSTQMKAYWNRPEKTQSSFLIREKNDIGLSRYYKTGDIGYIDSDGALVFSGRADRQIKIRGYRVELNEIESLLLKYDTVDEAAVYAKKNEQTSIIYASVKSKAGKIDSKEIIKYLSSLLPAYAIPSEILPCDSIPRTNAGKVDYKTLKNRL